MVASAVAPVVSPRALWFAVLAGPVAWLLDESIALIIAANACSGPVHSPSAVVRPVLAMVAVAALLCNGLGAVTARRILRAFRERTERADLRIRFLAIGALMLCGVTAFGIVLRLLAALMRPDCA
jgi:hypothetical protein